MSRSCFPVARRSPFSSDPTSRGGPNAETRLNSKSASARKRIEVAAPLRGHWRQGGQGNARTAIGEHNDHGARIHTGRLEAHRASIRAGSMVGLTDWQPWTGSGREIRESAAFEGLVNRHGPMVRSVCRSMLRDPHEADDAFQATFLVLARRAGAIRRRDAVGSWLYGIVACRVAAWPVRRLCARRRLLVRYLAEQASHEPPTVRPPNEIPETPEVPRKRWVARALVPRYRLGYLEGQSHEQAARVLGCPMRTVETRLQRGKARLRDHLIQRGLVPAAGWPWASNSSRLQAPSWRGWCRQALFETTTRPGAVRRDTHRGSRLVRLGAGPGRAPRPLLEPIEKHCGYDPRADDRRGPHVLRDRRGRPEGREAGGDDHRAGPRRPAGPFRRRPDADQRLEG